MIDLDAQAMALVKEWHLEIMPVNDGWKVLASATAKFPNRSVTYAAGTDLNRAICECVARMTQRVEL